MHGKSILISEYNPEQFRDMLKALLKELLSEAQNLPSVDDGKLLSTADLLEMLHVSKVTLLDWRKKKLIPYHRVARRIYYKKAEIMEAMTKLPNHKGRRHS
jgi:hypothetical protein